MKQRKSTTTGASNSPKDITESYVEHSDSYLLGFRTYPRTADTVEVLPTQYDWLEFKKKCDNLPALRTNLWRIHDDLYDLTGFNHPGGADFLTMTRGTDITELFESSHVNILKATSLLSKYHVAKADTPRNCTLTFNSDGFYCTLRQRIAAELTKLKQPTYLESTRLVHDALLVGFVIMLVAGMTINGWWMYLWLGVSATALALCSICAHNFFHQKDNYRMLSFDLTGNSSYEWRISHVYSHHCYPNSLFDYEISAFDLMICFFPRAHKSSLVYQVGAILAILLVFPLGLILTVSCPFSSVCLRDRCCAKRNLLCVLVFQCFPMLHVCHLASPMLHFADPHPDCHSL